MEFLFLKVHAYAFCFNKRLHKNTKKEKLVHINNTLIFSYKNFIFIAKWMLIQQGCFNSKTKGIEDEEKKETQKHGHISKHLRF